VVPRQAVGKGESLARCGDARGGDTRDRWMDNAANELADAFQACDPESADEGK
jgi:hypothetical protein